MFKVSFLSKTVFRFTVFSLLTAYCLLLTVYAQNGGVKGKVRTTRGDGIAGATVTARQKGEDVKSAASDDKGSFVLDGLEPGLYNLVFEKNGYSSGILYNVEVKKKKIGDLGSRLIMRTDQGTQVIIKGSVFNQDGFSIPGAKVEIEKISDGGETRKVGTGFSSQNGEFTFRFPEGAARFRVTATADGAKTSKEVEVDSAAIYRLALSLNTKKDN